MYTERQKEKYILDKFICVHPFFQAEPAWPGGKVLSW